MCNNIKCRLLNITIYMLTFNFFTQRAERRERQGRPSRRGPGDALPPRARSPTPIHTTISLNNMPFMPNVRQKKRHFPNQINVLTICRHLSFLWVRASAVSGPCFTGPAARGKQPRRPGASPAARGKQPCRPGASPAARGKQPRRPEASPAARGKRPRRPGASPAARGKQPRQPTGKRSPAREFCGPARWASAYDCYFVNVKRNISSGGTITM